MVVYTDKSKNYYSQELTALRAVYKGGGGLPQKSNWTGLQTVRREEGRVQFGGAVEENREEGREGGRKVADVVGARGRQHSVVFGTGGVSVANRDKHGPDGEVGNGGGQDREGVGDVDGEVGGEEGEGKGEEECGGTNRGGVGE